MGAPERMETGNAVLLQTAAPVIIAPGLADIVAPLRRRLARKANVLILDGTAGLTQDVLERAGRIGPAILLLPDSDVGSVIGPEIRNKGHEIRILVLGDAGGRRALELARAGCMGVVDRDATPAVIAKAVLALLRGEMWFSRIALSAMLRELLSASRAPDLTARERDILRLVSAGRKNRAIAEELGISHETVRWHIRRLNAKLHARAGTTASEAQGGTAPRRIAHAATA
ncbi:MAG: LuxR C-terminal-related transcriptional regulator [bacterium]